MNVVELISDLTTLIREGKITGEELVIQSKDGEGNYFSPMEESISFEGMFYIPDDKGAYYGGELYSKEDWEDWNTGNPFPDTAQKCICLWPNN